MSDTLSGALSDTFTAIPEILEIPEMSEGGRRREDLHLFDSPRICLARVGLI